MKHSHTAGFGVAAVISIVAILALGGYVVLSSNQNAADTDESVSYETDSSATLPENNENSPETDTMMAGDPRLDTMSDEELAADGAMRSENGLIIDADAEIDPTFMSEERPGEFVAYSGDLSYAETGDVVLFFHAPWCPSCRALESDIEANLSAIPDGVQLLKVDYDSETELKKKYGVVRQHTLVQVDAAGNEIKTLNGLNNTLEQVVSQL